MNVIDPTEPASAPDRADHGATSADGGRLTARLTGTSLHRALAARGARAHTAAVAGAFAALAVVNTVLNELYARSGFPVSYAEGQTTFDGGRLKEFYAVVLDEGSMGFYWATQLFDYVFMAAFALFGLAAASRLVRAAEARSQPRTATLAAAGAGAAVAGAGLDAIENLISFVMLAQPRTFADWIALPYSTAAAAKFAAVTVGMACLLLATAATAVAALTGRRR
ncbi:MAG: hypothetical protein AAGA59_05035 [Actinomycetota bacterium]